MPNSLFSSRFDVANEFRSLKVRRRGPMTHFHQYWRALFLASATMCSEPTSARCRGGNVTGFTSFEFGQSAKWLELLKEIAPRVTRTAVLLNRAVAGSMAQLGAIQGVAPSFGVEVCSIDLNDAGQMEHAITAFARAPNGGLIMTGSGSGARRELIITLATRHRLPAVYPFPFHVGSGGLTSYGPDVTDNYRLAAGYVDRILKGEKPADLPVQAPTKYRLAINLKTAKALGLDVPPTLLARADEVIE